MIVKFLNSNEINVNKWNRVLNEFEGAKLYARPYFLNSVARNWGAFVADDYKYIMPVVYARKWGIKYTYQPPFCQQLGVFSAEKINAEIIQIFLTNLKVKFKYIIYNFNSFNPLPEEFKQSSNYLLDLKNDYSFLKKNFSKNTKRNILKVSKNKIQIRETNDVKHILNFASEHINFNFVKKDFIVLENMIKIGIEQKKLKVLEAVSVSYTVLSLVFFYFDEGRIHYLLGINSPEGKKQKTAFLLFDKTIEKYANSNLILDFEGSNIPGVARFFKGWGAKEENYGSVKINNLTFPFNIIKK